MKMTFTTLSFLLLPLMAKAVGTNHGGGGNPDAAEFIRIASADLRLMMRKNDFLPLRDRLVDLKGMLDLLEKVDLQPTEEKLPPIDGKPVCAINDYTTMTIRLDLPCWNKASNEIKSVIAFHELWGLMYHDNKDDNYSYSQRFATELQVYRDQILGAEVTIYPVNAKTLKKNLKLWFLWENGYDLSFETTSGWPVSISCNPWGKKYVIIYITTSSVPSSWLRFPIDANECIAQVTKMRTAFEFGQARRLKVTILPNKEGSMEAIP